MTAPRDPDRLIHGFLLEGEEYLQDQVYDEVRAAIEHKRQRAFFGPWRTPIMNKFVGYGFAAVAVVAVLLVGYQLIGPPSNSGEPTPTATPKPTAIPEPTATPEPSPPPLTESFTSTLHGYSVSYPEGWTAQAATEPWTESTFPLLLSGPQADSLYDPVLDDHLFLIIASQPIGDATPEDWAAEQMASDGGCGTTTEPIDIDGGTGLTGEDCQMAVVATAGRGYWFQFYTGDRAPVTYDQAWFEEVLATVQLHPEDAID